MRNEEHVGADVLICPAERSSEQVLCEDGRPRPSGRPTLGSVAWLKRTRVMLLSVFLEIFDESAYQRFLSRTQMTSSRRAYAAFRKEHDALKARQPRCC
jgi:hypothetical protein